MMTNPQPTGPRATQTAPAGATQKVVIEGHTDAVGSEEYNDELSQRRAESVRRYLVAMHGIDASRLDAEGLGKNDPLPGVSPKAGENRREQFRGE